MPPSAGPRTVECTATMNRSPVSGSWRMTICSWSSSNRVAVERTAGWVAMVTVPDHIPRPGGIQAEDAHGEALTGERNVDPAIAFRVPRLVRCVAHSRACREESRMTSAAVRHRAVPRRPAGGRPRGEGQGGPSMRERREVSLQDKYLLDEGRILLTGVQGLVRLPLDQHRADRRRGLHTGTMISGYQGSPLGGLDKELARNRELV